MLQSQAGFATGVQPPATQPTAPLPPPAPGFLLSTASFEQDAIPYVVYVPPEYNAAEAWPVVLFLHGSGERGRDGFLQTDVGIARAIRRNRGLCPALVVMPQCPPDEVWWSDRMQRLTLRCLEDVSRSYHLDADRVYLTGLSLGGAGTWHLGAKYRGSFAALAPVCGFADLAPNPAAVEQLAPRLTDVPIWAFHGARDQHVPVDRSREMVAAVKRAGGVCLYTEVAQGDHFIWDEVYGDARFWKWLLAQRRGQPPRGMEPEPSPG